MDELDKLLSHSFEEIKQNGDLIIKLLQLSQNLLHLAVTDCEKQYRDYYEKLKTIKNKPMKQKNYLDKKYILKPGKVLYYNHTHFNNDTLTDQIAKNAIKRFPALVGAFLSEKERAILEAKDKAHHDIADAENKIADEDKTWDTSTASFTATQAENFVNIANVNKPFDKHITDLIGAGKFDEARELVFKDPKLLTKEVREAAEAAIIEGENKVLQPAETAAKKIADEAKKVEDEKPKAKGKTATKKKKNNAK